MAAPEVAVLMYLRQVLRILRRLRRNSLWVLLMSRRVLKTSLRGLEMAL